ncbi:helix-turn-helix transcriptional regulator [Streptomyces sp. 891-h]|uniref:helix-turn-helix transcriptional regulator n=1 Tax=Streptomyces sp. 891-h TaxID=2720714 RepID=UPI001FAAB3C2|nr:helix-turn-helix transcriptional regulator [Streptomyces sp. 891-h]UNZ17598.1 helix-turn-helix domain-containing protein [Streptomyces sp. 891-h]
MDTDGELGAFLRAKRARVRPEDLGLPTYGSRRRVPGLRREELAQLAGVSAGYYTRLEQGLSPNASDAVLDAVARVLGLDDAEHAHLYTLARPRPRARRQALEPERVRPAVRSMVESFGGVPALVLGRFLDVLAWNHAAHALLAGHLPFDAPDGDAPADDEPDRAPADRPNIARLLFLDPHTRELYEDWHGKTHSTVADLRLIAGRYPDAPQLASLIGDLSLHSPQFAALWADHTVADCGAATRTFRHPLVGKLTLAVEFLALPDDGQRVVIHHAVPGTPSQAALSLLVDLADDGGRAPSGHGGQAPQEFQIRR